MEYLSTEVVGGEGKNLQLLYQVLLWQGKVKPSVWLRRLLLILSKMQE